MGGMTPARHWRSMKLAALVVCLVAGLVSATGPQAASSVPTKGICGGTALPTTTAPSTGISPYVNLTVAGETGWFLYDFGANYSTINKDRVPNDATGVVLPFTPLMTHTFKASPFFISPTPPGGQLGILGTDISAHVTTELSWRADGKPEVSVSNVSCAKAALKAGLVGIDQTGHFASDPGMRGINIPVLPIQIAGISAKAQIDTGFDDTLYKHSININQPFYDALLAAGTSLPEIASVRTGTCAGTVTERIFHDPALQIPILDDTGTTIARIEAPYLILKTAKTCGGIASKSWPAALVGASTVRTLGTMIFDPKARQVFIRKQGVTEGTMPVPPPASGAGRQKHRT